MIAAPEIYISPVLDIVSGSRHFLPVTRTLCRSSVYDVLLKFKNLSVIVTGRKRILSVTHEIVPDSDRWPAVISCTGLRLLNTLRGISWKKCFCIPCSVSDIWSHLETSLSHYSVMWLLNCRFKSLNLVYTRQIYCNWIKLLNMIRNIFWIFFLTMPGVGHMTSFREVN